MITFILIAIGAILVVGAIILAYTATNRKRAGQSSQTEAEAQTHQMDQPQTRRPTGVN